MKLSVIIIGILLFMASAQGLRNPAAVYCEALGYDYAIENTDAGQVGYCNVPDKVDAWDFLRGEVATDKSYCAQEGYEAKRVEECDCLVCVVNGNEIEVTKLMNLSFAETECGDGTCGLPETEESCPQDCLEGAPEPEQPDTTEPVTLQEKTNSSNFTFIIVLLLVVIFVLAIAIFKLKK